MAHGDIIALEGLVVNCVVGVYPHERDTPQPLRVDLYMEVDTQRAAERQRLRETVDYAAVAAQVVFALSACRFQMLETAAHVLSRLLLAPVARGERRAAVQGLRVRLTKPSAFAGHALPYLEISRRASELTIETEASRFGCVDILHETPEVGVYRLNVAPFTSIPLHVHQRMQESEMVLSEGLLCQGKPVKPGTVHHWPLGAAHCYDNPTDRYQAILCVDGPAFIEDDEIDVEGEPAEVRPAPTWPSLPVPAR